MSCDESLAFALTAVLLIFVIFYVLSTLSREENFSNPSPADRYSFIDNPDANFSPNWSGNDDSDKTVVMDLTKARVFLEKEQPISLTSTQKLVEQEYSKNY